MKSLSMFLQNLKHKKKKHFKSRVLRDYFPFMYKKNLMVNKRNLRLFRNWNYLYVWSYDYPTYYYATCLFFCYKLGGLAPYSHYSSTPARSACPPSDLCLPSPIYSLRILNRSYYALFIWEIKRKNESCKH